MRCTQRLLFYEMKSYKIHQALYDTDHLFVHRYLSEAVQISLWNPVAGIVGHPVIYFAKWEMI